MLRSRTCLLGVGGWAAETIQILTVAFTAEVGLGRAQAVESPAPSDGNDPIQNRATRRVKCVRPAPDLHVHLLRDVLGSGWLSDNSQGQPIHEGGGTIVKLGQSPLTVACDSAQQSS